jgi:archaellum component FlaC
LKYVLSIYKNKEINYDIITMNYLKYLEFNRLMRELQFVESDFEYQSEIIKLSDDQFLRSVNDFLVDYPELDDIYSKKRNTFNEKLLEDSFVNKEDIEDIVKEKIPEAKKLYRTIVKSTHPDKVNNIRLNDLYKEATRAYEENDIITLYKVSNELNIEFEFSDDIIIDIRERIDMLKSKTKMLESTYTFKWIKSDDDERNKIILEFIKSKIK